MKNIFWLSYATLWILVVLLVALVLLLYRQFGLMLLPGGGRADLGGLDIGATAPPLSLDFFRDGGSDLAWTGTNLNGKQGGWIAVFASPTCPICERLWEAKLPLRSLAESWVGIQFLWIDSRWRTSEIPDGWKMAISEDNKASAAMDVPAFPFAYAITVNGSVAAKRLVNEPGQLSLLAEEAFGRDHGQESEIYAANTLNSRENVQEVDK